MTAPAGGVPQVGIAIVAQNAAKAVVADVNRDLDRIGQTARTFSDRVSSAVGRQVLAVQGSARGLQTAERALQTLAFQAAGAQGQIGRLASGLLSFAGGSPLVLGVAVGLGGIAYGVNKVRENVEALTKALEENRVAHLKRLQDLGALGQPELTALEEQEQRLEGLNAAQRRALDILRPFVQGDRKNAFGQIVIPDDVMDVFNRAVQRGREIQETEAAILRLRERQTEEGEKQAAQREKELRDRLAVEPFDLVPIQLPAALQRMRSVGEFQAEVDMAGIQQAVAAFEQATVAFLESPEFQRALVDLDFATEQAVQSLDKLAKGELAAGRNAELAAGQMGRAFLQLVSAVSSGDVGSIVGVAGGVVAEGVAGVFQGLPLLGTVLTGLGALLSLGGRDRRVIIDEYGPRAEEQMRRTRGEPQQVTVVLLGPNGQPIERTEYALARRSARDAVTRIPRDGLAA